MYKDHFVVVVKCAGKVLREKDGGVLLPFGSEYSILLKNLYTTRAAVSVSIDGKDVLNGSRLVIDPNEDCELEGFLQGNDVTHRFRFIEKTEQISEHRGDRVDDGLIRVEYQFEKKPEVHNTVHTHHVHHHQFRPGWGWGYWTNEVWVSVPSYRKSAAGRGLHGSLDSGYDSLGGDSQTFSLNAASMPMTSLRGTRGSSAAASAAAVAETNDGITVKGSASGQSFRTGYLGAMEEAKHSLVLSLRGHVREKAKVAEGGKAAVVGRKAVQKLSDKKVAEPLTVQAKLECETCGRRCKSSMKFCPDCGTALT
jgi:hypothetical protein